MKALLVLLSFCHLAIAQAERPNIVLIMCDDMGWSDIGCFGGEVKTPNIDRLAAEGMMFTQFYNNAKCTTTRASLITGLYPRRKGPLLKPNMVTIAEVLKASGYGTSLSGKWHLGSKSPRRPIDRGFDRFYGLLDGCCNFFDPAQPDPKFKGGRVRVFAHDDKLITEFPDDYYTTDAFTDHAIESIGLFAKRKQPFFVHVCYTAPHYPLHAKPEDIAKYDGVYDIGWDELRRRRHKRQLELGIVEASWSQPSRDPEAMAWAKAPHKAWQARRMAVYAAMIDCMDQNIGRLLEALDTAGVADNTLVMFLSDNGGCAEIPGGEKPERIPGVKEFYTTCGPGWAFAQNTPFRRYKTWMHEGGIATPMLARWPKGITAGSRTDQVAHIIDFLPTCLELCGGTHPCAANGETDGETVLPVEGLSFASVLAGKTRKGHATLCWEYRQNRAVRQGNWKLCWDRKVKSWELYDLAKDRTEMNDLAVDMPERTTAMASIWREWAKRTGVRVK